MPEAPKESKNFINLGVVVNPKGEVLMIRRAREETGRDGSTLRWAFPGGYQRFGESRMDCVRRTVLSETGYNVKVLRQISLRVHPQLLITIAYHLCAPVDPKPVTAPAEPHEVAEIKWLNPEELTKVITTDLDPKVKKELGLT